MTDKPRIAHLSGANATIGNSPPLVTSNKARAQHGLPLKTNPDGSVARFDVLRTQRLAAPATVYVEQFSAHPLERDVAELYGPPDGYIDDTGSFHEKPPNRCRHTRLQGRTETRRRALSPALYGPPGGWQRVGGRLCVPPSPRRRNPARPIILTDRVYLRKSTASESPIMAPAIWCRARRRLIFTGCCRRVDTPRVSAPPNAPIWVKEISHPRVWAATSSHTARYILLPRRHAQ